MTKFSGELRCGAPSQIVTLPWIGRWANDRCPKVNVVGDIAYLSKVRHSPESGYLHIVDISMPASPVELGRISVPDNANDVAVSGIYAYVAGGLDGLRIIDVSAPANPIEVGFFDTPIDDDFGVSVSDGYIYIAGGTAGLYIISNDLLTNIDTQAGVNPKRFKLIHNDPNPFNPATTIQFWIAEFRLVELKIYDVLGREVKTLVHEQLAPGSYEVQWDGTDTAGQRVASGVYLCRLRAQDFVQTQKMLVVR